MSKSKSYKEQELIEQKVGEPMAVCSKTGSGLAVKKRDNIESAISGEELLDRLRPRIKALFK